MTNSTLILNSDATPISLLPLSSITWQHSMELMCLDKIEVLHSYEDWIVRSQKMEFQVPAVVILKKQVHIARPLATSAGPIKHLVYLRDSFICQYCHNQFPRSSLTIDHVIPRCHGGKTRWENVTTACGSCNGKRGHDERIKPKSQPFRPTYNHLLKNLRKLPMFIPHATWNWYLGWEEDRIKIVDPRKNRNKKIDSQSKHLIDSLIVN